MYTPAQRKATLLLLLLLAVVVFAIPARAVVVRGIVTTPLGIPLGNARVQLIHGQQVAAFAYTEQDGTYEIRSSATGRFVLLTSAAPFTPSIGQDFYGARVAVVTRNIVMEYATVTPQVSTIATGLPTPLEQLPAPVTLIPQGALATELNLLNELRQTSGVNLIQTGQAGGPIALYVRGGPSMANEVLIDTVPAQNTGGRFDLSTLSSTALAGSELYRGPNSALYGTGAEASVLRVDTARGSSLRPVLDYTGDAGNLHAYRNEAILSGARNKLEYLGAFSRFDTSNDIPGDEFHITTSSANLAYDVLTNTQTRFTVRSGNADTGLPGPHDLYGLSASGKQSQQNIVSGLSVENQLAGNWHTLVRYGIVRNREQVQQFAPAGNPVTLRGTTTYYGNPVTVRGANGYAASGQATIFSPSLDTVSNRDELLYQTGYTFPHRIAALFTFHYENERSRLLDPTTPAGRIVKRTNYLYTSQIQGEIKHRLFYSLGGGIEDNGLYGVAGTPRIGLAYAPVLPGHRIFRGTRLRANIATGIQEPTLYDQTTSLFTQLDQAGDQTAIAAYHVAPITAERSRTYDLGIDQNIVRQTLIFSAGYFHNQFNHQLETVSPLGLEQYFGIPAGIAVKMPGASLNSLAYRTQGLETELRYQPFSPLVFTGGYTYLASIVLQSFSADAQAAAGNDPIVNPNLPDIPIGALSPLVGARPFRRPPHTGFFAIQFTTSRFSTALQGSLASRSDDSTFQLDSDIHGGNSLLLPNRNLDFGYAKLDLNSLLSLTSHITAFTQLDNLLGQQHIGPVGYPGLPFTIRAGLKIRVGGS